MEEFTSGHYNIIQNDKGYFFFLSFPLLNFEYNTYNSCIMYKESTNNFQGNFLF